mmetsp:Transcript_18024/g.38475  ORF Transcript_18024/g.38475 Transcript_18024/m.38475 type:complete len:246 (+) Transcript_18024:17-754(+)
MGAGCTRASQDVFCEPVGAETSTTWAFVGDGRGTYEKVKTFDYVGDGAGAFEKEQVTTFHGWRPRSCVVGVVTCLLLSGLLTLAARIAPDLRAPNVPRWQHPGRPVAAAERKAMVTTSLARRGLLPPVATAPRTAAAPMAVPAAAPTAVAPTEAAALPFDCAAGADKWESNWCSAKKRWCCAHGKRGCATTTTSLSFDCMAGAARWQREWTPEKARWCCRHGGPGCVAKAPDTTTTELPVRALGR